MALGAILRARVLCGADPAAAFTFDVDGGWRWLDAERVYRDGSNPPQLEQIRRAFEIRGQVLTPDGSPASGWALHDAILTKLQTRGTGSPTGVQIFDVMPDGTETARMLLGPPTWQGFRVEAAEADVDDLNPASAYVSSFGFYLRCSALLLREFDAGGGGVDGIVGFEQSIDERFVNGLREVTWTTTVTTVEGTDARVKAGLVGAIPAGLYGGSYTYLTNGADSHGVGAGGVDVEVLDPDTRSNPNRIPTKARAVSRVKEWGIDVGVTGPGSSPDEVSLVEAVSEDEEESTRIVSATARGPGALAWGARQAPADFSSRKQSYDRASKEFTATWEVKTESFVAVYSIQAELSGGHQVFDFEPVTGGYAPVRFDGAVDPWQLTIQIQITKRGGTGAASEMKLPPLPGEPWSLDWSQSAEGMPTETEPAKTAAKVKWGRTAKLVLLANQQPKVDPAATMRKNMAAAVTSYFLPGGAK